MPNNELRENIVYVVDQIGPLLALLRKDTIIGARYAEVTLANYLGQRFSIKNIEGSDLVRMKLIASRAPDYERVECFTKICELVDALAPSLKKTLFR